ncbi:MAG: Transcriptional regulator, TrmB [Candidatus Peregrinibacteria bacterium Greene0416_62]|nr:MAG: Transcriptional regulator, TrmB [Candidatus Peregrinibacteria bacterium Greene0416_62]TSD00072.1 MAG: Transcriptional regulator, TrmB [Candidatus Peregrinibacteria bacterium Greene1014_49]
MKNHLFTLLQKAGFRDEEAQLYLALLKLKKATLTELHVQTKMSHTTTYRTIHRLIDRGLIEQIPLNKKQSVYRSLSLSPLISSIEKEKSRIRKLELSLKKFDHLLPYMDLDDTKPSSGSCVEIHEGIDAFHEEYLKLPELGHDEFLAIGSSDSFWKASNASIDSSLERSFVSRRLKNNVYSRSMMVASNDAEKIARNDAKEMRTTKMKEQLPVMSNMLMMSGNQVSHFVCDVDFPHVIVIRDPELVAIHKNYFEDLWRS